MVVKYQMTWRNVDYMSTEKQVTLVQCDQFLYICMPRRKKTRKYISFVLFYIFQNFGDKHVLSVQDKPSVQLSRSVVSNSLRPHKSQHTRPPFPSPTPRVHTNSCASSQWCHPAISSSVIPFSSCPQSLPTSGSFPMSQLFAWGGQSTEFQLQHQSFQWTPRAGLL